MTIITRDDQLRELCTKIDAAGRFAMDLEFIPERTYSPELCLIQVATDEGPYIVDPLAVRQLLPLWERVASPDILVVLHAAEQDLQIVHLASGLLPQNIMDTQIAAGFAGFGYPVGYGKLLHQLLGVTISKTESYTDWLNRPLSESQVDYALDDVRHLLPMYDSLVRNLEQSERFAWVQEECKLYCKSEYYEQDRLHGFMRVKGASALTRRGLAVLQSLYIWRDGEAYRLNRPPRTILPDNIMLELSRRPPGQVKEIQRIRGVRTDQINTYGNQIIAAIKAGLEVPDKELPSWPSFKTPPRREVLLADMLFAVLKVLCYDVDLAPELVATRSDLQTLVRSHKDGGLEGSQLPLTQGWRRAIAGDVLCDLLNGSELHLWMEYSDPPIRMQVDRPDRSD